MFFVVIGDGPAGPLTVTCETALAAYEKAVALARSGAKDILIADPEGRRHAAPEFRRRFVEETR